MTLQSITLSAWAQAYNEAITANDTALAYVALSRYMRAIESVFNA